MEGSKQDDEEESVRIAVKALDEMRNSTNSTSRSHSDPNFVARMSHLPFVNSAIRVYEQGKASSRMVKYGAEIMESSVKTISRPVINRLPVHVNQLDEFACRQLDRLDRYRHTSAGEGQAPPGSMISPDSSNTLRERKNTLDPSDKDDDMKHEETSSRKPSSSSSPSSSSDSCRHLWREGLRNVPGWLEANSVPPPPPPDSRSSTPTQNGDDESRSESHDPDERRVAQRSRWQAVLLEAGGLSAALSEESIRRLKYCLHWLQYATAYIDAHILFLRNFTADLQPLPSDIASSTRRPPISEEHMRRLIDVRRDIVHTIRQVVDIVSKYAGGALPEPAKTRVRGFILTLPQRWASKAGGTASGLERDSTTVTAAASGSGATRRPGGQRRAAHRERGPGSNIEGGLRSGTSSRAPSPSSSPRISRTGHLRHGSSGDASEESGRIPAGTALVAAQRILALATESLDMMRNVTGVMKDSLDRAEAWVGRLRTVGIQRDTQQVEDAEVEVSEFEFPHHRRQSHHRSGSSSQFDEHDMPLSPFFSGSSSSSTAWGSSIPSTPGGGTCTPTYGSSSAPSPGAIPIGSMSLASSYNTPRSGITALPDEEEEEEEEEGGKENRKVEEGDSIVKVVSGGEEEESGLKMDVDV